MRPYAKILPPLIFFFFSSVYFLVCYVCCLCRHFIPFLFCFLWPTYGIGQAIIFLPCGFFFLLSIFFSAYSQPSEIGCLPYFHTWCSLSANLGYRSQTCCMRLAEIQDAKNAKKSPFEHHRTTLSGCIFATKACIDNRKKIIKQQCLLHMSAQYGELRPTSG